MNKKIKNLFLAGALVLGFAGVAVSCTDYDDDINKLKEENSQPREQVRRLGDCTLIARRLGQSWK